MSRPIDATEAGLLLKFIPRRDLAGLLGDEAALEETLRRGGGGTYAGHVHHIGRVNVAIGTRCINQPVLVVPVASFRATREEAAPRLVEDLDRLTNELRVLWANRLAVGWHVAHDAMSLERDAVVEQLLTIDQEGLF